MRAIARRAVASCWWSTTMRLLPALRVAGLGYRPRQPRDGARPGRRHATRACDWLLRAADPGRGRRLGGRRPGLRPGGWAFQYRNRTIPTSTTPPWSHAAAPRGDPALSPRRSSAAPNGCSACRAATAAGARSMPDNTHLLSQQHPVRRSRRPARSADRRRDRALHQRARPARHAGGTTRRWRGRSAYPAPRAGGGRLLVRPLGHQLHLRHLVGAVRAQRRRHRPRRSGGAARRWTGWSRSSATDGGWGED